MLGDIFLSVVFSISITVLRLSASVVTPLNPHPPSPPVPQLVVKLVSDPGLFIRQPH